MQKNAKIRWESFEIRKIVRLLSWCAMKYDESTNLDAYGLFCLFHRYWDLFSKIIDNAIRADDQHSQSGTRTTSSSNQQRERQYFTNCEWTYYLNTSKYRALWRITKGCFCLLSWIYFGTRKQKCFNLGTICIVMVKEFLQRTSIHSVVPTKGLFRVVLSV